MTGPFRRVAWWCWYRGEGFAGFQQQGSLRTVQAELLRAFAAAGLERNPVVAGRTDRGVSARMQVLSSRLRRELPLDEALAAVRAQLPPDVGLHLVKDAGPSFNAAWSASSKEYRYDVPAAWVGDRAHLAAAAALVPGTRDFRVFHFKTSELMARTVTSVELLPREGGALTLRFVGEGFARYMVRMLAGAMLAVSRDEVSLDTFRAGLEAQVNFGCPKAPPEPLTLWSVGYPPELDPFTPTEREAFSWPRADAPR